MPAQLRQPLHRAQSGERGDHPVGKRQPRAAPHPAKNQFIEEIGEPRSDLGVRLARRFRREQPGAQRSAIAAQSLACRHPLVSLGLRSHHLTGSAR